VRAMAQGGRDLDGGAAMSACARSRATRWQWCCSAPGKRLKKWQPGVELAAELLLSHLLALAKGDRGKDLQVETTLGDLYSVLNGDALLRTGGVRDVAS